MVELQYVAFDPGKSTGIAGWFDPTKPPVVLGEEVNREGLAAFLKEHHKDPIKKVMYEPYRVFNNVFNHQGNDVLTARIIGQIEAWATIIGAELVEVRPELKRTAAKWAGVPYPKGHCPNWQAAFFVGYYDLRRCNLIPSRVLQQRQTP